MRAYVKKQGRIASIVSAMMIAVLFIGLIPNALAADTLPFSDVPKNHTYYDDICWAAENGIATGYNGKFDPDREVTVLQFYTMLSRSIPEDESDTGSLGAEKGTMIYHLRRAVRHGWTGRNGAEIELRKDNNIAVGSAWNYALTANGTQVYANSLYGGSYDPYQDGMRAAKELGLITEDNADEMRPVTRAEAVSIIHAAHLNTKAMSEPPIVTEMKGAVKNLPQSVFNDFYADMAEVPEPIRKAFIKDGWTICFDTDKISAYSDKSGIYGIRKSSKPPAWMRMFTAPLTPSAAKKSGAAPSIPTADRRTARSSSLMRSGTMYIAELYGRTRRAKTKKVPSRARCTSITLRRRAGSTDCAGAGGIRYES